MIKIDMKEYQPEKIYLERKVADSPVSRRVLQYWNKVSVQLINSLNEREQDRTDGKVMLLLKTSTISFQVKTGKIL